MKTALRLVIILSAITGLAYSLVITALARVAFPAQASGSVIFINDKPIGSKLLAQEFTSARYFWPRPSVASYATVASGASNLGPTSMALKENIAARSKALHEAHRLPADAAMPDELVTTSGSGLDPHLSPQATQFQAQRVAQARGIAVDKVQALIAAKTESPQWGILGEARVNVLELNLALDALP